MLADGSVDHRRSLRRALPRQRRDQRGRPVDGVPGQALFLVGCASCHGKNGEGIVTKRGTQYGPPLAGVGAAAVDFQVGTGRMPMARPGVQAQRKKVVYSPEEITALGGVRRLARPRPVDPRQVGLRPRPAPSNASIVRGGQFFKTNCTACHNFAASGGALPGGKFAPSLTGVTDKHIYEAMLTGPQQMPVFSDGVLTPDEKRDIIAYLNSIENDPKYGGASLGSLGPVSEGLSAWLVGIGALVGVRHLDRVALRRARRRESRRERRPPAPSHEHAGHRRSADASRDPIADPGLHEHEPRPTDVDEHAEKRAERQIATLFGLSERLRDAVRRLLLRLPRRRRPDDHRRVRRLQRRARRRPRPGAAAASASPPSSGRAS